MKSKIAIFIAIVFAACSQKNTDQNSVEGIYVLSAQSEDSKAIDTIKITSLNRSANTYSYERRVGYHRLSNGQLGEYGHKVETSTCLYNENTEQLSEQKNGRTYSFSDDGNLVAGGSIYKRIH